MFRFNVLFRRNMSPSEWRQRDTSIYQNYMHTSIQVNFTIIQVSAGVKGFQDCSCAFVFHLFPIRHEGTAWSPKF